MEYQDFLKKYQTKDGLFFCLILSFALKVFLLVVFEKPINTDGVLYISVARHLAEGQFGQAIALYPMPLYPLLIAILHFLFNDWEISARLVCLFFMVSATVPLYLIARDLFNSKAAFWSALAFGISPMFNEWALDIIRGPGFVFCVLWAVWFSLKALETKKTIFFFLASGVSFFSIFFRIEAVFVIVFSGLFFISLIMAKGRHAVGGAKGFGVWLAVIFIFGSICIAASGNNQMQISRFDMLKEKAGSIIQLKFMDNYKKLYDQLEKLEKQPPFSQESHNLLESTRHFMYLVYFTGLAKSFVKVMFPCFFVVLFLSSRRKMSAGHAFVLGLAGFYVFMVYLSLIERDFMQQRFLFAPACLLYPWVGKGLENLFGRIRSYSRPGLWLAVFCIFFIAAPFARSFHIIDKADDAMLEAGRFAAEAKLFDGAIVITNDDRLPFYAGLKIDEYETMPAKYSYDFAAIKKRAKKMQADIVYIKAPAEKPPVLDKTSDYCLIKKFSSRNRDIYIYGSGQFCRNMAFEHDGIPTRNP
jgi:4-amino-4-deoxy-L-arabinose transferase-like glycosyltransferase